MRSFPRAALALPRVTGSGRPAALQIGGVLARPSGTVSRAVTPQGPRACVAVSPAPLLRPRGTAPLWPHWLGDSIFPTSHSLTPHPSLGAQHPSPARHRLRCSPALPLCSGHAAGPPSAGARGRASLGHIRSLRLETVRVHIPPTAVARAPLMTDGVVSEGAATRKRKHSPHPSDRAWS